MEEDVAACRKLIAENAPGRDIRLGITEWNTTAGDWGLGRAMLWTLDNALWCSRYHNFMHRHCDMIEIANRSNLTDSFCSGIIQTNSTGLFKTPTYYAQQLYATHAGTLPLKVASTAEPADPALDISATLSADEERCRIFAVNPSPEPQKRTVDLPPLPRWTGEVTSGRLPTRPRPANAMRPTPGASRTASARRRLRPSRLAAGLPTIFLLCR